LLLLALANNWMPARTGFIGSGQKRNTVSKVTDLHDAVKRGDIPAINELLDADRGLANARSETDVRGTFPLHVAAEFGR
jgi:hypothetical protein